MSAASATQEVQVSVGKDFVIMGGDRVEVSPDGKQVTADAKNGFEVKAASGASTARPREDALLQTSTPPCGGGGATSEGAVPPSRDGGISIDADFNTVVLNGVTIERAADGHLVISAPGGIVKQASPANDSLFVPPAERTANRLLAAKTGPEIGDLDDGGIYVGLSAENGKPLHAALADLPDYRTYEEALEAAEQLKSLHPTAHVPTPKELDQNLFENRNTGHLKGTFNTSGSDPGGVYRSSASYYGSDARVQWFDDGLQASNSRHHRLPTPARTATAGAADDQRRIRSRAV
jgi:hypothetical protein